MTSTFPRIELSGTARERGRIYGSAAADRIRISLNLYAKLFRAYADLSWDDAKIRALRFEDAITGYLPDALDEMRGIAEGSGTRYEDILALNCRSELMFALPDGCSTLALPPECTQGKTLLVQTWDWLSECRPATVILEIRQPPLPTILSVSEAGMIGGKGINTAGLGVCLNALSVGRGQIGVPLHVLYRGILNSTTVSNALDRLVRPVRAGAGAFTIGSESGVVLTFEYTPDDFDVLTSEGEPLCHTNHYLSPLFTGEDTLKSVLTDSYVRYDMLRRLTKRRDGPFTMDVIRRIFTDHVNYPDSICSHEDPQDPETARFCSVYGVAMDLDEKTLWVTDANPCEGRAHPFRLLP